MGSLYILITHTTGHWSMRPILTILESELNPKVDELAYRAVHCLNDGSVLWKVRVVPRQLNK